jgi:hypothetical protein
LDESILSSNNEQFDTDGHGSINPTDSSIDSVAAMKRNKNREAAIRSRQRKKAEQNQIQSSLDKVTQENNKLKLDNAALRAENQILKRHLNYFENLFAKKTQSVNASHSTTISSTTSVNQGANSNGPNSDQLSFASNSMTN